MRLQAPLYCPRLGRCRRGAGSVRSGVLALDPEFRVVPQEEKASAVERELDEAQPHVVGARGAYKGLKVLGLALPQEEKVSDVERELNEAQHRVDATRGAYEAIVRAMSVELARFQRERSAELAGVLRAFAVAQVRPAASCFGSDVPCMADTRCACR